MYTYFVLKNFLIFLYQPHIQIVKKYLHIEFSMCKYTIFFNI